MDGFGTYHRVATVVLQYVQPIGASMLVPCLYCKHSDVLGRMNCLAGNTGVKRKGNAGAVHNAQLVSQDIETPQPHSSRTRYAVLQQFGCCLYSRCRGLFCMLFPVASAKRAPATSLAYDKQQPTGLAQIKRSHCAPSMHHAGLTVVVQCHICVSARACT